MGGRHQMRDMKDGLGPEAIARLADNLATAFPRFAKARFISKATAGLEGLELKARVVHVATAMREFAPEDPREAIAGLLAAAPAWNRGDPDDNLRGFATWPVFEFVDLVGQPVWECAMRGLAELTHLFTAEFAVRSFIAKNTEEAMAVVREWTQHESDQVRRLASEGIRPRLPWASKLPCFIEDPAPVLRVLDALVDDESMYVRRSVANCLSDIAADHPNVALETARRWLETPNEERRWIAKRGTRNLIKSGHPGVWALHGFTPEPKVSVLDLQASSNAVALDEKFSISFSLASRAKVAQKLVVDFVVHHVKASGGSSAKVFKLSELALEPGQTCVLEKNHAFRNITTRRYYPGAHRIEVQINGKRYAETSLDLVM